MPYKTQVKRAYALAALLRYQESIKETFYTLYNII
jgi:hypothetical protein